MNLCEGRVGKQEAAAAAWMACISAGIFTINTRMSYADGNAAFAASLFAALLALGAFWLTAAAMRARRCDSLSALYRYALGGVGGFVLGLITSLMLVYAAMVPMGRILNILCRYIYIEASPGEIALYFLPVVAILAFLGLETITRTARLFVIVVMLSIVTVLVIAIPAYETFRLYPLLGGNAGRLATQSVAATIRYLPALLALLACGRGVHGVKNASRAAIVAVAAAAILAATVQFCEGMAYSFETLSSIPLPLYRLTSTVRSGGAYLRTDKLLLFFWLVGALLAAAFLCYAAALLYTRCTGMRDCRPPALVFSVIACALALLAEKVGGSAQPAASFLWNWAWAIVALPPLLAAGVAMLKRREPA